MYYAILPFHRIYIYVIIYIQSVVVYTQQTSMYRKYGEYICTVCVCINSIEKLFLSAKKMSEIQYPSRNVSAANTPSKMTHSANFTFRKTRNLIYVVYSSTNHDEYRV